MNCTQHLFQLSIIRFDNAYYLFQVINGVSGDILTITQIRRRRFRWRRYHANSQILIITIPTSVHESLHLSLHDKYYGQLVKGGIQMTWMPKCCTSFRASHSGGDFGEGDSTGGPHPGRLGRSEWPTLVIETGDSESLDQLHVDMQWWYSISNHDVKIVILTKFDHGQCKIILDKWDEEAAATRLGATTTRRAAALQSTIAIGHSQATNPVSYNVTRGALILSP
ncbi:hypothetical protein F4819DRAFT_500885 [Hypoxylon fuscum]|nr:hypothetical protein F4819DRAFT_500885 [Hypoxylon fuscum]